MLGEFCLMRGVDESCLLSFTESAGNSILIKLHGEPQQIVVPADIESLAGIHEGEAIHLASADGLCAIERDGLWVRFKFIGQDRKTKGLEIESVRFDAVVAIMMA